MAGNSCVEIRYNLPNKGRGLFACQNLSAGDTLFEEKPLVCAQFLWNALYKYAACEYCLRSLETVEDACRRLTGSAVLELPHPECCETTTDKHVQCDRCQLKFCSVPCREAAMAQYHDVLCMGQSVDDGSHPLNRLADAWRKLHYPPETCSIMLLAKMIATVKQADDKQAALHQFSQFCKVAVNEEQGIAHKLLGNQFQDQLEILRKLFVEHFNDEHIQQWLTPEGFSSLFALIGTNGQGIGSSSISRWVHNCEDLDLPESDKATLDVFIDQMYEDLERVSGPFLNCEGSGLYSLQSTCNHSCEPNAEVTFPHNNSTLVVKTLRDIGAGEEILISYLDECDRERSRHSRQKQLKDNYLFVCSCIKCTAQIDDPDMTSEEEEESMEEGEGD